MKTSAQFLPDQLRMLALAPIDILELITQAHKLLVDYPRVSEEEEEQIRTVSSQLAYLQRRMAKGRPLQEQQHE